MNPNDPNNQNLAGGAGSVLPKDPNAPSPEELTPEALYGPSTPGVGVSSPATPIPPAGDPMQQVPQDPGTPTVPAPPAEPSAPAVVADPQMPISQEPLQPGPDMSAPAAADVSSSAMPNQDLPQTIPDAQDEALPTDMPGSGMGQEIPQDTQPVPDASTFYQEAQPTDAMPESYDPNQPAPQGYEPYQQPETEAIPQPGYEQPAPIPTEAPVESSGGNLPPIPKRSKLPIIIMGVAVLLLISAVAAFFMLGGSGGGSPAKSPIPTEEPLTCNEDPGNPDCIAPTNEPTVEPTVSVEPSSSGNFTIPPTSTPAPSTRPCDLLGTC